MCHSATTRTSTVESTYLSHCHHLLQYRHTALYEIKDAASTIGIHAAGNPYNRWLNSY